MQENLKYYEEISHNMIDALENEDYDLFDTSLEKRQAIIDIIIEDGLIDEFKKKYNKEEIFKMDKLIKSMLETRLNDTKIEIREYKSKIQGNNAYSQIKKDKFNIFYKKV